MQHVFGDHITRTIEVYINDIVVKTRKADDLVNDLRTTFECLGANRVKLNPEKCIFGVLCGMLLRYIIPSGASSPTLKKSRPSTGWSRFETLKGCRRCWGALPPCAASSHGSARKVCPYTGS
jgi:hypothetical protein